ncbi:MAG: SIS domain-containing protein [Planctomycetes bacterium]|nr:SIS domain-containing protein [Planctomycetota bacterium]
MPGILDLLALRPSAESLDYVQHKTQFHLHTLLTEQRHPRTWDLGGLAGRDAAAALRAVLSVDDDLEKKCEELAQAPQALEQAAAAIADAVLAGHRIYVYGCGATGRLAKQMESTFWRPFWRKASSVGAPADYADRLTGEMTGADRALVSSLEGFEDLLQLGRLQLEDHGIRRGDVVVCVTEGGETSSVIGTMLAARAQYGPDETAAARRHLYFLYNNPDELLRPFDRCRLVLDEPGITRIPLATGPQAIAGSTRMQATTIETFVLGAVLEEAALRVLRHHLPPAAVAGLGFAGSPGIPGRLRDFAAVRSAVTAAVPDLARCTELEAATYAGGHFSTYFARAAMITVFVDCTERSPTFRLYPLDKQHAAERRCWVQVWTEGEDARAAWTAFLGRPFRGLQRARYLPHFERIEDPWLRRAALKSLAEATDEQELHYDFGFSPGNVERRGPRRGDLGVLALVDGERRALTEPGSREHGFAALCAQRGAALAVIRVGDRAPANRPAGAAVVDVALGSGPDPLALRRQIALKILLNAHSTVVMARLGRIVGNTMTNVSPSNLKLIGRATFLVLSHVNDTAGRVDWPAAKSAAPLTFAEANAVLYDAIDFVQQAQLGQTAEVALAIVRVLETLRTGVPVGWPAARAMLDQQGLQGWLARHNPALSGRG